MISLQIRKPFQLLLVCVAVLSLYYVVIFSEFCLLDDRNAILGLSNIEDFDLKSILFPNATKGGYYRPLIGILYMVDRFAFGLEPRIMHFDNIVFHLVNVVLLYIIALELFKAVVKRTYLPLLVALLFAVHPIATESINWISGRTDLLVGMFILLATFIMIKYREQRPLWLWSSIGICVLFGLSAKETALAYLFVALLLFRMKGDMSAGEHGADGQDPLRGMALLTAGFYAVAVMTALFLYNYILVMLIVAGYGIALCWRNIGTPRRDYLRLWLGIVISLVLALTLFFVVLKLVYVSDLARIPQTVTLIMADPGYALKMGTGAIGFYVKKFLVPFPLNLAIREIDPLYELIGIGLLLLAMLCVRLGGVVSSLFLAGLCMLAPALPFSLGTLAWTAYAERYIYLSTPFWLLAAAIGWHRFAAGRIWVQHTGLIFAVLLSVVWTWGTFERNLTWRTNLGIFEDTVQKSPDFKVTRGLYMLALYENGRYDEALEQYRIASLLPSLEYDEKFDMLYAFIKVKQGHLDEARSTFENILHKKETIEVLENFRGLLVSMRNEFAYGDPRRQEIDRLVIQFYDRLYRKSGNALYLYRLGQEHLNNKKRAEAQFYFARAARELPESSEFKNHARTLALKLK